MKIGVKLSIWRYDVLMSFWKAHKRMVGKYD